MRIPSYRANLGLLLVTILMVTGCASAVSSTPSPGAAASSPAAGSSAAAGYSAGATPAASVTPQPPSLAFDWPAGTTPAVTTAATGINDRYINPGAIIEANGTFHMYANVFSMWPGAMDIVHLTSTDGVSWVADPKGPVLTSDDVPFANPGMDVSTGYVTDDGTWVLVIESVTVAIPWMIGRATAPGPDGPWTVDPEPILAPGPAGSIDAGGVAWPSVVRTDDGFAMYHTAFAQVRGPGVIARATSSDGVTWTKASTPVLTASARWEHGRLDRPRVVRTDGGYLMLYAGAQLTDRGAAWSDDGVTWRRDGELPVISRTTFPTGANAWDAALIEHEGAAVYYLEIGNAGGNETSVYRAVAPLP